MGSPAASGRAQGRKFRRVWLPKGLYEAMPWVYCSLGGAALLSGMFLPEPGWRVPYLLLLAVTALHVGAWCLLLRRRYRLGRLRRSRQARCAAGRALPDAPLM